MKGSWDSAGLVFLVDARKGARLVFMQVEAERGISFVYCLGATQILGMQGGRRIYNRQT
jgi:hypothetical protein